MRASQVVLVEKNLTANAGDIRNLGLIPRSLEEGMEIHSSILAGRIPWMGRGAFQANSPQGHTEPNMTEETACTHI